MRNRANLLTFALIVILTVIAIIIVWPSNPDRYLPDFFPWPKGQGLQIGDFERETMRLGLDLKGGTYMLLEGDRASLPAGADLDDAMEGARDVIEKRINEFGVAETEIQRQGSDRLALQLPGIDPEEAREKIGRTALLSFYEPERDETGENVVCTDAAGETLTVPADVVETADGSLRPTNLTTTVDSPEWQCIPTGSTVSTGTLNWIPATGIGSDGQEKALTGRFLRGRETEVIFDAAGRPFVQLKFSSEGGDLFEQITTRLLGLPMAIFLDEELISAPTVQDVLSTDSVITGLELDEADTLSRQLRTGAMPIKLEVIQETTVDATLGDDSVRKTVQAGEIGILAVIAFMILYYRLAGALASTALVTYTAVLLMIFKVIPVTLTLAGIAAFVLSVGMAVDANILIFERMKEELRAGRGLVTAIETGFARAWPSIRDSNVSTFITCGILWWFGDQFGANLVKGFALTLGIGVAVSMFSAIIVTRTFLRLLVGTPLAAPLGRLGAEAKAGMPGAPAQASSSPLPGRRSGLLDFVHRRGWYFLLSVVILVPGVISLLIPPALKPGVEFASGTSMTVRFEESVSAEDVRSAMADIGRDEARVQRTSEGDFIIRMGELEGVADVPPVGPAMPSEREAIENELEDRFGPLTVRDFASVSEIVSREIARDATIAVVAAAVGILLYIIWAFRHLPKPWRYGICAIIAVLHDTLVILGAFSIFGKVFGMEINTMFITGLLTIIGFSVHDTIVVFDRIRENITRNPGVELPEIVNASLTETLARSLNTSLTLILTIGALLLLGGVTIQSFLLVLLIGVVSGTYSSIFVAAQLLVSWEEGDVLRIFQRLFLRPAPAPGT
ncbi:MAG: protein translocase subunit SecD [Dehalococcoidia bacterium]|nr:MAG: protein translocase subunit SecD [Dehalococcoidia bacterium]